jgi:hypothetical protein
MSDFIDSDENVLSWLALYSSELKKKIIQHSDYDPIIADDRLVKLQIPSFPYKNIYRKFVANQRLDFKKFEPDFSKFTYFVKVTKSKANPNPTLD